jgi:hypothetical protein
VLLARKVVRVCNQRPTSVCRLPYFFVEELLISSVDLDQTPSEYIRRRSRRHRPSALRVPTVACHVAFWKPIATPKIQSERLDAINKLLNSIYENYGVEFKQGFDETNQLVVLKIEWHSIQVTLRFVLHEEVVSYAIYIHADSAPHSTDDIVAQLKKHLAVITTASCAELLEGQGAFLLEKRGWVDRAGGLIEVSYSASRSFRMAAS